MNAKKLVRNPGPIAALALVFFLGTLASAGYGAALSWDPTGIGSTGGGSGTWNTTSWWNATVDGPWVSGTDAAFQGTAGTVSLSAPITANNLFFNSSGYSIGGSTLTLTGGTVNLKNSSVSATIGSIIAGSAGLTQTGTGTLTLTGPNTYTGTTTISSGTLLINNTNATTAINVGLGSKVGTLGGSGSATSATATVPSNAKNGIEAGSGGVGSLTLGGLKFLGAADIYISNIGQYASAAAIDVTGNNGLTVTTPSSLTFVLSGTTPTGTGSVRLLQYAGALQGTPGTSAFITPTAPVGTVYTLSFTAGFVDLNYTIDHLVWTGSGTGADAGVWTLQAQSPSNWKWASAGTPTNFQGNAPVVFDDSAGTNTTVSISGSGSVNPGSVTFSNSSVSYLIQGTSGITQQAVLTKNGNGSLTIANSNGYYGGTVVNAGRLNVANSAALGTGTLTLNGGTIDNTSSGPLALAANNSLAWNGNFAFGGSHPLNLGTGNVTLGASAAVYLASGAQLTIGGPIADSATGFTQNGQGLLVLTGSSSYTGQTNVNAGTLSIGNGGSGASINTAGGVALGANTTLLFNHSDAVSFAPAITGGGAVFQSGGLLSLLNGGNSYSGGTVVTAGTLQASTAGGVGPTGGSLTVASGGVVDMNNVSATLGAFNGSGLIDNSGSGSATLTVGSGGGNGTFSGTIRNTAGMLSLVKTGAGTLFLSGTGSFTGATTINGGQLNTSGAALQGSTVNLSINNSLTFSGTAATLGGLSGSGNVNLGPTNVTIGANNLPSAYTGTISGAGGLTKTGSGVFSLVTPQNYGGATNISGGTLRVAAVPTASLVTTNVLYDLDASNPASYVLTGGSVTAWNDSSGTAGTGTSFTSGTSAASAVTVVNGGASFNGNNVMYFNGTGNASLTSTDSAISQTVFIVEKVARSVSGSDGLFGDAGQNYNIRVGNGPVITNPGNASDFTNGGGSLSINGVHSTGNAAAGQAQLLGAVAGTSGNSFFPWPATTLSNASTGTSSFNGYIGEVVAYGGFIADSDRRQMEAYLMYKWLGIVPSGGASNLLPATTPLTISNSGTFDMTDGTQTVASLSSTDGKGSKLLLGNSGMLTVGGPTSTTFDGVISGIGGSLVKQGAGNQTLSGVNTYGGGTTVTGGTLQLGDGALRIGSVTGNINTSNNTAVVVANPAAQIFSNMISGNGAFGKSGSGTLTISSTQAYTGATLINKGVVRLVNEGALSLSGFGGAGTGWQVNSSGISSTPITNDVLTLTDGANNESRSAFYTTQLPVVAFNASFIYQPALGSSAAPADGVTFMLQNSSAGVSALGQTNNGSALGYAGSSLTTPGNSPHITPSIAIGLDIFHNTPTGQMYWFSDGTQAVAPNSVSPVNLFSGDPIQVNVNYDGTNYLYLTLTDNGLTYSSSRAVGNLVTLLGGSTAYVGFSGATGGANATQTISNFSFTLLSGLAGSNSGNILPATTATSIASGGTLDLFGGPQQIASLSGGGVVTNSANGALAALTVSGSSATSFSGTINDGAGQVSLALTGGTLTLGGNNSYSGGTTINGGVIVATKTAGLGTGPVDLGSGTLNASANGLAVSSLTVADSGPSTLSVGLAHPLAIGGSVNLSSGGTLNISGVLYSLPALVIGYGGAESGTFDSAYYNGNPLPAGDSLSYSGGSIEVVGSATFFSGSGSWIGTSNAWNSSSNWTDGFGHHGVPGDGTRPAGTDAASFSGSSSVTTINLSPTNPNLSALSFSNSNYTLSSGSLTLYNSSGSATITVLSGTSTFNATSTLNLAGSTTVNPSAGAQLTINGSITGIYPLTLNGPGTLVLSGNSNFGGGINVAGGTLIVTNGAALADGSSLTVGSAAAFPAPLSFSLALPASATPVSPVPEPGTLALFVVGGIVAATAVRRFKHRTAK